MKKCTIGLFSKIITFLVFAVFFVPLTGICFYIAFLYPQTTHEERLIFLAGVVMFGGFVVFAIYRTFYLGLVWVEYDMEKVIFHYSRKEKYGFKWEEIPGSRVQAERAGGGYVFCIQENGRQRKIPLNHLFHYNNDNCCCHWFFHGSRNEPSYGWCNAICYNYRFCVYDSSY